MAVRALIPAERLNIAHVNSVDGSTDYESGTEYKAGTVVTYNGNTYVANIDIEDTDTDTPDAAADKWGLCPNAKSLVEGGEVADLENRVAALETTVGDENSGLVKDVDDIRTLNGYAYVADHEVSITPDTTKTVGENLTALYDAVNDYLASLDDDILWSAYQIVAESGWFPNIYNVVSDSSTINADFVRVAPAASELRVNYVYFEPGVKALHLTAVSSTFTDTNKTNDTATDSIYKVSFHLYKKILE